MIILDRPTIESLLNVTEAKDAIAQAYIASSQGQVVLPPVGHITFPVAQADCHIKYGHILGQSNFVIKVATGFPNNASQSLPTDNGLSMVVSAETGQVKALLLDEMYLTDVRTAIGSALCSQALARKDSRKVLILGTGPQAIHQVRAHAEILGPSLEFRLWGRTPKRATRAAETASTFAAVEMVEDLEDAVGQSDIIITATGARLPLIQRSWVKPGTHLNAVGADAPGKQELDPELVANADLQFSDLKRQSFDHGEFSHALRAGSLSPNKLVEIGVLLAGGHQGRTSPHQITITDLTGIASQDIAIANHILSRHQHEGGFGGTFV